MSRRERPLVLGVELDGDGAHPAAWRASSHSPAELLGGRLHAERAHEAERAGFAFATFADSAVPPTDPDGISARLDAIQRAAFVAPLTSAIGLVPEAGTVYTEPFHVATQLASLDFASRGRAGWVATAADDAETAALYGRDGQPGRPQDAVEVARRLWDSWEDDAVIRDVATGRYLDRNRLHHIRFTGDDYSIVGPSIVPRPPQGALPVFGPAALAGTAELDAALFDVRRGRAEELLARATHTAEGLRSAGVLAILDLEFALDAAGVPAHDRVKALDARAPWPTRRARYIGTADGLIDLLVPLASVVDGIRLHPAVLDIDLAEFAFAVAPRIRDRVPLAIPRPGDTLRATLGLPDAVNRYQESA
ncbi:LLM class flavin-dependent oxidoreductase [Leifsonia sp. TF02-11]|uniref:LLM class flavin-dependent oxidoreductase n=1 Tax=Leifsonia sp. TF02-11 TaxID=2815212 RepID=UPI001AA16C58|nr:LLM class flavin-dependent oxidoreductase [Leifsonia sp. TF02-11]MBO1739226.1 LLM class flavin-dependent oxidoreductase [Leifsonia sp. TF02-11]